MKNSVSATTKLSEFVKAHILDDTNRLILSGKSNYPDIDIKQAVVQIECRRKTRKKLQRFNEYSDFLYPSLLAAEQASHQAVAQFHSKLLNDDLIILDMTAGLGIDAFTIASSPNHKDLEVIAIELDPVRVNTLLYNKNVLRLENLTIVEADSISWLSKELEARKSDKNIFDLIFIDPARRNEKGRTYFFADCLPNVVSNQQLFLRAAKRTLIKSSPMLDLSQAMRELPEISNFYIVCVKGECKEVLCELSQITTSKKICVIDLDDNGNQISKFDFDLAKRGNQTPFTLTTEFLAEEWKWLYDPNSGIHKAQCGMALCAAFPGLTRVSTDTDLYISKEKLNDFPGKRFRIEGIADKTCGIAYDVAVRNYPLTAQQIIKKLKLKPGKNGKMMFGFRVGKKPILLKTHRE